MTARALLIGVNYFNFDCELKGCINDANNMLRWLASAGYEEFELMVDSPEDPDWHLPNAPTGSNILRAIDGVVARSAPGDTIFFHFSGHGSQLVDEDGDEFDDMDECICPADSLITGEFITDDVLRARLIDAAAVRGVRVRMVLDCCHSGTGADLPWVWTWSNSAHADCSRKGTQKIVSGYTGGDDGRPMPADIICISGCKDNQTSADVTKRVGGQSVSGGALTTGLLELVRDAHSGSSDAHLAPGDSPETWGVFMKKLRENLAGRFTQLPQLSSADKFAMSKVVSWC